MSNAVEGVAYKAVSCGSTARPSQGRDFRKSYNIYETAVTKYYAAENPTSQPPSSKKEGDNFCYSFAKICR